MSARSIPAELEPAIYELMKQKKSTYYIAAWLKETHGISTSHMSVHRAVERIRMFSDMPDDLESALDELDAHDGENLRILESIAHQLGEYAQQAADGDLERGIAPNRQEADELYHKQARILETYFRRKERLRAGLERRKRAAQPPSPVLQLIRERLQQKGLNPDSHANRIAEISQLGDAILRSHESNPGGAKEPVTVHNGV